MINVLTAIGNPELNNELKKDENINVICNDIIYQDGIIEIILEEKNINYIIISELIIGDYSIDYLIEKIKEKNNEIKLIIILDDDSTKEKYLYKIGVDFIFYNNQIKILDIINIIKNKYQNNNEEIKDELNKLKEIVLKNNENIFKKLKIKIRNKIKNIKKIKIKEIIKSNPQKIISIIGSSGTGKSIFTIIISKIFKNKYKKILIIDFDILNNSLHTLLGVKKYSDKIKEKIKNDDIFNINVNELIIKINKKIDLISGVDLVLNNESQFEFIRILEELKNNYELIIIDTSCECFFDKIRDIIKISDYSIFLVEPNLLEIKKAKRLLEIYDKNWKIKKEKINIVFNKYNSKSIDEKILKNIFSDYNILGKIKLNIIYNKLINNNFNNTFIEKNIKNEYIKISEKILKIKFNQKSSIKEWYFNILRKIIIKI